MPGNFLREGLLACGRRPHGRANIGPGKSIVEIVEIVDSGYYPLDSQKRMEFIFPSQLLQFVHTSWEGIHFIPNTFSC